MSTSNENVEKRDVQPDDQEQNEERALSVFASEKNEDLTALGLVLVVTFLVLLFTKWLA